MAIVDTYFMPDEVTSGIAKFFQHHRNITPQNLDSSKSLLMFSFLSTYLNVPEMNKMAKKASITQGYPDDYVAEILRIYREVSLQYSLRVSRVGLMAFSQADKETIGRWLIRSKPSEKLAYEQRLYLEIDEFQWVGKLYDNDKNPVASIAYLNKHHGYSQVGANATESVAAVDSSELANLLVDKGEG